VGNQTAIDALVPLLSRDDLDNDLRSEVADALGDIGVGNQTASDALAQFLAQVDLDDDLRYRMAAMDLEDLEDLDDDLRYRVAEYLDDDLRYHAIFALGDIGVGNQAAIDALVPFLTREDLDDRLCYCVVKVLRQIIGVGNEQAIEALAQLLARMDLEDDVCYKVTNILGEIGVGNEQAIDALAQLLARVDLGNSLCSSVTSTLGEIVTKPFTRSLVSQLKNYVTTEVKVSNFDKYKYCYRLIFPCALTLPYPDFHAAWHQTHLP
jgi:HEAT repeat protein